MQSVIDIEPITERNSMANTTALKKPSKPVQARKLKEEATPLENTMAFPLANIDGHQRTMVAGVEDIAIRQPEVLNIETNGPGPHFVIPPRQQFPTINQYHNFNWPAGGNTGRIHIADDSTSVTNFVTHDVTFNKVRFTKPVVVTHEDLYNTTDAIDNIIIKAHTESVIKFNDCFFDNNSTSNAISFNVNTGTTANVDINFNGINAGTTASTNLHFYDNNGNLITHRDGIIEHLQYTPEERRRLKFKEQLRLKQAPAIMNHRGQTPRSYGKEKRFDNARPEEIVALHLLKSMLNDDRDKFKRYLKHGFVTIQGPSGLVYQIKRKSHIIDVWNKGKKLCTLCVYLQDHTIPPTDEVIAKMIICELDEIDIWRRANIGWTQALGMFNMINKKNILEEHLVELRKAA